MLYVRLGIFFFATLLLVPATDTHSLTVRVLDASTGLPVASALVHLSSMPARSGTTSPPQQVAQSAFTSHSGECVFSTLPSAEYWIHAIKPGFAKNLSDVDPASAIVDLRQGNKESVLKLNPLGIIEGRVVDQDAEPLEYVRVLALQTQVRLGLRSIRIASWGQTDDRGLFHIPDLPPGRYFLKAVRRRGILANADPTSFLGFGQNFAPRYAGGASLIEQATPIHVGAGTRSTASIQVRLEPSFRVQGNVQNVGIARDALFDIDLLQGEESIPLDRNALNPATGRFELYDIVPGNYVLRFSYGSQFRGEVAISVGASDVNDVSVTLVPAVQLKGFSRVPGVEADFAKLRSLIEYPGKFMNIGDSIDVPVLPGCKLALHEARNKQWIQEVNIPLWTAESSTPSPLLAVLPGTYRARVTCNPGHVTSITFGNQDLRVDPEITIKPDDSPPNLEVQVQRGGGTLHLSFPPGLSGSMQVLLVPTSGSAEPTLLHLSANGESEFLAPGTYSVYAFPAGTDLEYLNPAFLEKLSGGPVVRIEDNKATPFTLRGFHQ